MRKIEKIVFILFLCLFCFSLYNYLNSYHYLRLENKVQNELIEIATSDELSVIEGINIEQTSKINFEELKTINKDVVGWIKIDGTNIDYPVVQSDNNSYYLKRNIYKEYSPYGTIFIDATSSLNFSDNNTFIYGHNTLNRSMFADIKKYMNKEFYKNNHAYLYTPTKNYKIEIFSAYYDDAMSDSYILKFNNDLDWINYLDIIKSKSFYKTNVEVNVNDSIITLYSCSFEKSNNKDNRYFIHGKLIEI